MRQLHAAFSCSPQNGWLAGRLSAPYYDARIAGAGQLWARSISAHEPRALSDATHFSGAPEHLVMPPSRSAPEWDERDDSFTLRCLKGRARNESSEFPTIRRIEPNPFARPILKGQRVGQETRRSLSVVICGRIQVKFEL